MARVASPCATTMPSSASDAQGMIRAVRCPSEIAGSVRMGALRCPRLRERRNALHGFRSFRSGMFPGAECFPTVKLG